jgi:septum formation protein
MKMKNFLFINLGLLFNILFFIGCGTVPKLHQTSSNYNEIIKEKNEILLTSDTIVTFEGKVLGKPKNREEAVEMLQHLSGKTHQVYTAVSFKTNEKIITKTDVADVEFSEITDQEINFYIENYHPFDKAGSYGIQEWLGMAKISKINGSFYTIMGLPTHLVYETLKDLGF